MMVKCEFRGGSEVSSSMASASTSSPVVTVDDEIREGEELFFLKGAWEQVLALCQYAYEPATNVPPSSSNESHSVTGDVVGLSTPLTESRKKEIGEYSEIEGRILIHCYQSCVPLCTESDNVASIWAVKIACKRRKNLVLPTDRPRDIAGYRVACT